MKFTSILACAGAFVGTVLFTGCVNDDYDLSNLNKEIQLQVVDLTVPLNLDEITMSSIIKVEEGDRIQIVDGKYAIIEENDFDSESIMVDDVTLSGEDLDSSSKTLPLNDAQATLESGGKLMLDLASDPSDFDLMATGVSSSIVTVEEVGCRLNITIALNIIGFGTNLKSYSLENVKIRIPKGLYDVTLSKPGDSYNPSTGIYTVATMRSSGPTASVTISVSKLDFEACGAKYDYDAHSMTFADALQVVSGDAVMVKSDFGTTAGLPSTVTYRTDFDLSELEITSFTGQFTYQLNNFNIPDVDLSDIPKLFSHEGTDITLVNPQLYLSIDNPMAGYGTYATMGMDITALREDESAISYPMGERLTVNAVPQSVYCLSPMQPDKYLSQFSSASYHQYADLGKILAGDGLPTSLIIDVDNPMLPVQPVVDFKLGQKIGSVKGSYYFYAPLEFADGSTVYYNDTIDGWWSEDMDNLTINKLTVTAKVTTDVPLTLNFTGYPIDKDGKQIGNVEITGADVPAFATDYPITLVVTGAFAGLNGITIDAKAAPLPGEDADALTPDMNIDLKGIRAKVSGHYDTKL